MRRYLTRAMACLALAGSAAFTASPALAASNSPITITLQPTWTLNTTSDAQAPIPSGVVLTDGSPNAHVTNDININYGISYRLDKKSSLSYNHVNADFSLGRIVIPTGLPAPLNAEGLWTGDIRDRIDIISYNYSVGHGLNASVYYLSHQRMNVAGECLNQEACTATQLFAAGEYNAPGSAIASNPASVNMTAYGVGFKYTTLRLKQIPIPLLTLGLDIQYVPRNGNLSSTCGTTTPFGGCNSNNIAGYVGSGTLFPYSATLNVPILPRSWGALPFIDYKREAVWWRSENTPEAFNVVDWGIIKPLAPNLTLSVVNTRFNGCLCSVTVPPPDNIRFTTLQTALTYLLKP
jgi:hypothetical protein